LPEGRQKRTRKAHALQGLFSSYARAMAVSHGRDAFARQRRKNRFGGRCGRKSLSRQRAASPEN